MSDHVDHSEQPVAKDFLSKYPGPISWVVSVIIGVIFLGGLYVKGTSGAGDHGDAGADHGAAAGDHGEAAGDHGEAKAADHGAEKAADHGAEKAADHGAKKTEEAAH